MPRCRGTVAQLCPICGLPSMIPLELRVDGALETRNLGRTGNERLARDESRSTADAEVAAFHTIRIYLALVLRTICGDIRFDFCRIHPGNPADERHDTRFVAEAAVLFVLRAEHRLMPFVELTGVEIPDCVFVQAGGCRVLA